MLISRPRNNTGLLLDNTALESLGPFAKIGPPIRSADGLNRNALQEGTANDHISTIGSDHAPGNTAPKELGWDNIFRAPNGDSMHFGAALIETIMRQTTRAQQAIILTRTGKYWASLG